VGADLDVAVDGAEFAVASTGDRLFVELPSMLAAVRAERAAPHGWARAVDPVLRTTDLTLEVRVRETTVVTVGADARPGVVSDGVGVTPAEIRLGGVVAALGREATAAARAVVDWLD
jgi:hypothetical protein